MIRDLVNSCPRIEHLDVEGNAIQKISLLAYAHELKKKEPQRRFTLKVV